MDGGTEIGSTIQTSLGTHSVTFVATNTTTIVRVYAAFSGGRFAGSVDNISVREINPLSVSIQMDGRMTYAGTGAGPILDGVSGEVIPFTWRTDGSNYIFASLSTFGVFTGSMYFLQEANGVGDFLKTDDTTYSPDTLVPFSIASRHGSTFLNGAVDGVALTADTTPTSLPDLSSTDLQLGYDFMGTIGLFRVWANDIGDAGIVEASAPSLEPSLSLTFDGTGTSFTVDDWSE
jgi:hypothetical protein